MKKFLLAALLSLMLAGAGAQVADAHHGHNDRGNGHEVKDSGHFAGQLAPGHAKHH